MMMQRAVQRGSPNTRFVGRQGGRWIVETLAYLENKGSALGGHDQVRSEQRAVRRANDFPHEAARRPLIPEGRYFIEPGLKSKYSHVTGVSKEATFILLHGQFHVPESARVAHGRASCGSPRKLRRATVGGEPRIEGEPGCCAGRLKSPLNSISVMRRERRS